MKPINIMVGVAMTNYAAPQNNGHSVAFDAVAYPVEDGEARNTLIVEAGETAGRVSPGC